MQEMQEIQERPYGATDETTVLEVYVALGTSQTCRGCRKGALCAPENGEQRTENRTRDKRATGKPLYVRA